MILGFKQKFVDGEQTRFAEKIIYAHQHVFCANAKLEPKIHSLRTGERWKDGMSIEMAYGVRTKEYYQFNKGIKDLETCISTQAIFMTYYNKKLEVSIDDEYQYYYAKELLVKNDGLNILQFLSFFFPKGDGKWGGQIIHWTGFKY